MADLKISELTNLTAADPANDMIPIVDVSATPPASGSTKRISINNILACSPTATLASATISGDLTVDTSTLKVDSANNRVGVGTATPDSLLQMAGAGTINWKLSNTADSVTVGAYAGTTTGTTGTVSNHPFFLFTNNTERHRIASDGIATWSNVGGVAGTAMILNATGLGVGGSPTAKISCTGYSSANQLPDINIARSSSGTAIQTGPNIVFTDGTSNNTVTLQNSQGRFGVWNYGAGSWNERLIVDANGNCGIGVTPSAWRSTNKALQVGSYSSLTSSSAGDLQLFNNAYINSGGANIYQSNGFATRYEQYQGVHAWYTSPSGTAGNAITFTERLRLKETGQLRFVPLAADPAGAEAGDVYYNSTSNKLKCYNGTTWNDLF